MLSQVVSSFRSPFQAILAIKQSIQDQMKFSTNSNETITTSLFSPKQSTFIVDMSITHLKTNAAVIKSCMLLADVATFE